METSETPVTPIKQALVEIAGHAILAALLPDGRIAASFRMICGLLCLDHSGQMRRILADSVIADSLILATMQIGGQQRTVYLIVAEAIPIWLKDIQINKVAPEARETLAEFQRVAVQTLRAFFFPETGARQQQQTKTPQPPPLPLPKRHKSPTSVSELLCTAGIGVELGSVKLKARLILVEQKNQQLGDRLAKMERQHTEEVAQMAETERRLHILEEEREALWVVLTDYTSATPHALTNDHQRSMHLFLRACHRITGQPTADLEHELAALVGVAEVDQIPEAAWDRLIAWFAVRLGW